MSNRPSALARNSLLSGLLVALLVAAPFVVAQVAAPPAAAEVESGESVQVAHWVGNESATVAEVESGRTASLWFGVSPLVNRTTPPPPPSNETGGNETAGNETTGNETLPNATLPYVAIVNVSSPTLTFETQNVTLIVPEAPGDWQFATTSFSTLDGPVGVTTYSFTVTIREGDAEGAVVETFTGDGTFTIAEILVPQPPTGIPTTWIVGGIVALVLVGGAGAYAMQQRRERERMNRAPRRSQVMREAALERELERARAKEPERAVAIQQEIREQERTRETRRELQILEAKRADALKTMDLLRKRHEAGGLTKLQYDNMVAKKQADLERIEREIAEMEGSDSDPTAAA